MPRTTRQKPLRPTIPSPTDGGGLFHDPDALLGTETFHLYASNGKQLGTWHAAEGVTDTVLIEAFLDFLDRKNPPRLTLLPSVPPRAF